MSNVKDVMPTPLQRANELLRSGAWNDSLLAYLDLWKKSPQLRNLVAGNINYLLLKAQCSALKRESVIEILGLLDKSGYKAPLKARQLFSVWGDEEKRGQRESVSKKLEPNKSTQHLVQTERCQVGQVLKDALCVDQVY
ncbi:hypothetical protein FDE15_25525, partial [Vibrio parahaemolyticus]|uniref:hypothetical protein n=1 Tax=Vibrio parahaemolyticus TaxID=670 RepID=UPI00128EFDBB